MSDLQTIPQPAVPAEKFDPDKIVEIIPFGTDKPVQLSVKIVQKLICSPSRSGKVCDAVQAIRFIRLCEARGLNPFEGDAFLLGYDSQDGTTTFSLITAHQAFLKRAESHHEYNGMESGVILYPKGGKRTETYERQGDYYDPDYEVLVGGWARVHFKTREYPTYKRLRLATFDKHRSRWKDDPAGMICKCAEADALRSSFPSLLGGLYTEGENPGDVGPGVASEPASRRRVSRAKPITATTQPSNPVSSVPGQPESAPATPGQLVSSDGAGEQHLDERPNHCSPTVPRTSPGPEPPHADEGSEHQGSEQDEIIYPTVGELATLAETLKCPEDQCLNWAESAVNLLAEGCIDDAYKYIGEMPWNLKPAKGKKPAKKPIEVPEDEIPF